MKQLLKMKKKGWISLSLICVIVMAYFISPLNGVHASGYDYQKAVEYADRWGGSNRNPDYNNYTGADCANYVSQCLRAGGVELGDDWKPYTLAWIQVPAMVRAFQARGYQVIENPTADQIYPGNPVIYQWKGSSYEWSHATICVGYDENGTPIINGHTSDRYHVKWNYGAGSANKMCTILINDGGTQLGNVADLGNEFYAYINSTLANKPLTNEGSNVCLRSKGSSEEEIRSQVWKFVKQEDGSYVIYSAKDNNVLDVAGAETGSGTNVQTFGYWGSPAQRWYIYEKNGEYRLKSQCSDCLLDVANAGTTDGTNIQMCKNNGNTAQIFQIEKVNTPGVTNVYCTPGTADTATIISWDATNDTTVYNVRINGDSQKDVWNVTDTSCQVELPAGNYEVYVNACNAFSYSTSATVAFTVQAATSTDETIDVVEDVPKADDEEENAADSEVEAGVDTSEDIENVESETKADDDEKSGEQNVQVNIINNTDNSITNIWNYIFNINPVDVETETTESIAETSTEAIAETVPPNIQESETEGYEFDNYGGTDNDDWSRNRVMQEYEQGTLSSESPVTVVTNSNDTEVVAQSMTNADDNSTYAGETTGEAVESAGIRIVEERDENGNFQGLFLRIVFPGNGENQVLTIRLM